MEIELKKRTQYFALFIMLALAFISAIIYLSILSNYHELKQQQISITNEQFINEIKMSINFGKSLENYYGMNQKLEQLLRNYPEGFAICIYNPQHRILYATLPQEKINLLLKDRDYRTISQPISLDNSVLAGELLTIYPAGIVTQEVRGLRLQIMAAALSTGIFVMVLFLGIYGFLKYREKGHPQVQGRSARAPILITVMLAVLLGYSTLLVYLCQKDYQTAIIKSSAGIIAYIKDGLERLEERGVLLEDINGLSDYLAGKTEFPIVGRISINILVADSNLEEPVSVQEAAGDDFSISDTYISKSTQQTLEIRMQGSRDYLDRKMTNLLLLLGAALITGFIFIIEMIRLPEALDFRRRKQFNHQSAEQFSSISANLRIANFLGTCANYICFPFAAMLIREWNQSLPGLSVGMTAAFSIAVCAVTEALGMFLLAGRLQKLQPQRLLLISNILLVIVNLASFAAASAGLLVLLRALAGLGLAGNKSVNNYIIGAGYHTKGERERHLAQSNAGLIGGILCGTSLGAIIAAVTGYEATFLSGATLSVLFMAFSYYVTPWKLLYAQQLQAGTADDLKMGRVLAVLKKPQLLKYFYTLCLAINFSIMLIVTLTPAVIQEKDLPEVLLSYCYLLNGLAGLYIGPRLIGRIRRYLDLKKTMLLVTAVAVLAIYFLKLSPLPVMLLISSLLLGLVDGIGTPTASDLFLELREVRQNIDDVTALGVLSLYEFINLALAPFLIGFMLEKSAGLFFIIPLLVLLLAFHGSKHLKLDQGPVLNASEEGVRMHE